MTKRFPLVLVTISLMGIAVLLWNFFHLDPTLFFRGYLFAYLFTLGLALGSLTLLMLHNLTGGAWGDSIRPALIAAARTIPLLAILFLPIAFNLSALYPWARPDALASALLAHREPYLNASFFLARAIFYFAIWIALAHFVPRNSSNRALSAAGLILYLLTMTHAGIDWIMSRDTDFHSTAFGFVITLGQTLSALAFILLLAPRSNPSAEPHNPQRPTLFNDLGNILLTLVILWIYVSFMQFLVVWMGNSHEDNAYYVQRGLGSTDPSALAWRIIGAALLIFHFFIPFFILLFRSAKNYRPLLTAVAAILFVAHILEQYWLVAPADHAHPEFNPTLNDALCLLTFLALWLLVFLIFKRQTASLAQPPHLSEEAAHA